MTAIQATFTKVLEDVKDRWDFYRHAAFLKKHDLTEEQYQRQFDTDINPRAYRVSDYYHGYPHVYVFTSTRVQPFTLSDNWIDAYNDMTAWCKAHCHDKWRHDILRVVKQTGLSQVGDGIEMIKTPEWLLSDIGGGDCLFFAFKDSKDYAHFLLRWS